MPDSDLLLRLVSGVYAAAADPEQWPETLQGIADALGSRGINLFLVDRATGCVSFSLSVGIPDERLAEYNRHVVMDDPRIIHAVANPQLPVTFDYQHTSEAEIDRDPYYAWLAAEDFRYYAGSWAAMDERHFAVVAAQRSRRQGHVGGREVELLGALAPHLRRALALSLKLGGLEARSQAAADAAEALPYGLLVLDERGRVLLMNREARRIVEISGALAVGQEGLRARHPAADWQLQRLIGSALSTALGHGTDGGGTIALAQPTSLHDLTLLVVPLMHTTPVFALDRPAAIVFIADPSRRPLPTVARLRELWGLTPAESGLALALTEGERVKATAERLCIAERTARVQLNAILRKTGARRHAELVRLLLTSVASLGP